MSEIAKKYLLNLHDGQKRLNNLINNSDADKFVGITNRQWGKSTFLCGKAIEICSQRRDAYIWYVTPFYKQAAQIFLNVLMPLLNRRDVKGIVYSINKSTMTIRFKSGSILQFQSAENYEGLRGATLTHLICDEFAFFRPEAYEYALSPMMDVKGEKTFFFSTPRGLNKLYEYWNYAEKGETGWVNFKGNYLEIGNPKQIAEIEKKRLYLPPEIFRQEYECAFVNDSGGVFKDIPRAFTLSDYGKETEFNFAGIDLGQHHDRTVLCVLNENAELVYFKRFEIFEQSDSTELVPKIKVQINRFENINVLVEKNFNPAVYDQLYKESDKYISFTTNNKIKNKLVSNLQYYISSGLLKMPLNEQTKQIEKELLDYEIRYTKVRNDYSYSAPSGGYDDCIISLALACWNHKNNQNEISII
jgi:hypothetical protein